MMLTKMMTMVMLGAVCTASSARAQFDVLRKFTQSDTAPAKQIAYFALKDALVETPVAMPPLFGQHPPLSLKALLSRLKKARLDANVVAVVVDLEHAAMGLGQLEEVHAALRKFAAVDKDVYVHADSLSTLTYALATGTSHISVVPTGNVWLLGFHGEMPYLRGLLDKLGIVADFERFEAYKSAVEPLTRTGPSPEAEEMNKWLFDGLYDGLVEVIAKGRGLSSQKVRAFIDNGIYSAQQAKAAGLIDAVQYREDFLAGLKKQYGPGVKLARDYGDENKLKLPEDFSGMVSFLMEIFNSSRKAHTKPSIAIVYVEGAIATGQAEPSPFGSASGAFSTTIRKALDKAAKDPTVKAVVLRVDSPGGSALASEIILHASKRVAKRKPLVVSMGNVAGSGGYYVACGADTIFADKNTFTASIGVLGGKLVTTDAWNKIGINWHVVERGKMAGIMGTDAVFTPEERKKIHDYMSATYEIFKKHVVEARGKHLTKPIQDIAGGRVFTGAQALELGLVDKIGGLEDAVRFAAKKAAINDYEIRVIPEPASLIDMLMGHDEEENEFVYTSLTPRRPLFDLSMLSPSLTAMAAVDPLRVRAFVRALQRIELIHREGVIMMMPEELLIR